MKFKENDVFRFRYNSGYLNSNFEPYHCFEALLVATKKFNGKGLYLVDTYWGTGNNKFFQINEAKEKGTLEFLYNLDEVEPIKGSPDYYDDKDLFYFTRQHGCTKEILIRKGAVKSKSKIAAVVNRKLTDELSKLEWTKREIKKLKETQIIIEYIGIDGVYI